MEQKVELVDGKKACCREEANIYIFDASHKDLTIFKCRVCGCRHFEAIAELGTFKAKVV